MAGIGSLVVRQVNMASQAARARFQVVMPAFEVSAAAYIASFGPFAGAAKAYVAAVRPLVQAALKAGEAGLGSLDQFTPLLEGAWLIPVSAVRSVAAAKEAKDYAEEHEKDKLASNESWQSPAAERYRGVADQQRQVANEAAEAAQKFAVAHTAFGAAAVVATALTVSQLALAVNMMANTQLALSNVLSAPAGAAMLQGFTGLLGTRIAISKTAAEALAKAAAAAFEASAGQLRTAESKAGAGSKSA